MNSSVMNKLELLGRIAEMKRIYTVIQSSIHEPACIVVTSAVQGEGKSTLAAGLALSASKATGGKVLVVDLNWYAPSLHTLFGVGKGDSASGYFNDSPVEKLIWQTSVKNLDILPVPVSGYEDKGSDGRAEKKPVADILRKAKQLYDVVVVDTAPAYPTNQHMIDPIEVCKYSDGVVIVTLTSVTPRQELKRVCTSIETVGANILGVVANHFRNPLF